MAFMQSMFGMGGWDIPGPFLGPRKPRHARSKVRNFPLPHTLCLPTMTQCIFPHPTPFFRRFFYSFFGEHQCFLTFFSIFHLLDSQLFSADPLLIHTQTHIHSVRFPPFASPPQSCFPLFLFSHFFQNVSLRFPNRFPVQPNHILVPPLPSMFVKCVWGMFGIGGSATQGGGTRGRRGDLLATSRCYRSPVPSLLGLL